MQGKKTAAPSERFYWNDLTMTLLLDVSLLLRSTQLTGRQQGHALEERIPFGLKPVSMMRLRWVNIRKPAMPSKRPVVHKGVVDSRAGGSDE